MSENYEHLILRGPLERGWNAGIRERCGVKMKSICDVCGAEMVDDCGRIYCPRRRDPIAHPESTPEAKLNLLEYWLDQMHPNWRYDFSEWQRFGGCGERR